MSQWRLMKSVGIQIIVLFCVLAPATCLAEGVLSTAPSLVDELSSWDILIRNYPNLDRTVTPAEREVLQMLTPAQAEAYANGMDADTIFLVGGQTLAFLLAAKGLGGFSLPWITVDGGGDVSAGGIFRLTAVVGQADAGVASGGIFSLRGGFLVGNPTPFEPPYFFDGFESGDINVWSVCVGCV